MTFDEALAVIREWRSGDERVGIENKNRAVLSAIAEEVARLRAMLTEDIVGYAPVAELMCLDAISDESPPYEVLKVTEPITVISCQPEDLAAQCLDAHRAGDYLTSEQYLSQLRSELETVTTTEPTEGDRLVEFFKGEGE